MNKCKGKSGWIQHCNYYDRNLGTKYSDTFCNKPKLINSNNNDITFEKCKSSCENNSNCDYFTHSTVKGDKNRECNLRWKNWNHNAAYPNGRPCVPKNGKENCDLCYQYQVPKAPNTNNKRSIYLSNNSNFNTYIKPNVTAINCNSRLTTNWNNLIPAPNNKNGNSYDIIHPSPCKNNL